MSPKGFEVPTVWFKPYNKFVVQRIQVLELRSWDECYALINDRDGAHFSVEYTHMNKE